MKIRNLLIPGFVLVLVGLLASCMPQSISMSKVIDKINHSITSELMLTAEQTQKLNDFTDVLKASMAENNEARMAQNAEYIAMIESPVLDQAKIRDMVKTHVADSAQKTDVWLDKYLPKLAAFHDSLTPEQLKKASAHFQKWMARFKP